MIAIRTMTVNDKKMTKNDSYLLTLKFVRILLIASNDKIKKLPTIGMMMCLLSLNQSFVNWLTVALNSGSFKVDIAESFAFVATELVRLAVILSISFVKLKLIFFLPAYPIFFHDDLKLN